MAGGRGPDPAAQLMARASSTEAIVYRESERKLKAALKAALLAVPVGEMFLLVFDAAGNSSVCLYERIDAARVVCLVTNNGVVHPKGVKDGYEIKKAPFVSDARIIQLGQRETARRHMLVVHGLGVRAIALP